MFAAKFSQITRRLESANNSLGVFMQKTQTHIKVQVNAPISQVILVHNMGERTYTPIDRYHLT